MTLTDGSKSFAFGMAVKTLRRYVCPERVKPALCDLPQAASYRFKQGPEEDPLALR